MNSDEALGCLSRTWTTLEFFWNTLAWTLMECDQEVGQIVTRRINFSTLLDSVVALSIYRNGLDSEETHAIKDAALKADRVRTKRNDLVHSTWYSDKGGEGLISTRVSKKHGLQSDRQSLSVGDILSVKEDIEDAVGHLVVGVIMPYHSDGQIRDISQEEMDEMLLLGDKSDE